MPMYQVDWVALKSHLDAHAYMSGICRDSERVKKTAEVFTPSDLVIEMLRRFDLDLIGPGRTVLDPACGDGQFLVAVKWIKMNVFSLDETDALSEIFGIDLKYDNVELCRSRLGGGSIACGDALNPTRHVDGQTELDRKLLRVMLSDIEDDHPQLF